MTIPEAFRIPKRIYLGTTVEKITAAIVGLLCAAAGLTAILYFSFTMEF
jgi:hypothetical protein